MDEMRCTYCGGVCGWMGVLGNLTHTKCRACGAINSQVREAEDDVEARKQDGYYEYPESDDADQG